MPSTPGDYQVEADLPNILHEFLTDVSYELQTLDLYPAVEENAQAHFKNNGFSNTSRKSNARSEPVLELQP